MAPGAGEARELTMRMQGFYALLHARSLEIGETPAVPRTARGWIGKWLVRFLHRALWWYTGPLQRLAESLRLHAREGLAVMERLAQTQQEQSRLILSLEEQVQALQKQVRELSANAELSRYPEGRSPENPAAS
jgi:hypothetical protein